MNHALIAAAEQFRDWLVTTRRDLHQNPELSLKEKRTGMTTADALEKLGLKVRRNLWGEGFIADLDVPGAKGRIALAHPAVLEFVLPEAPRHMLRLRVGLLSYSARLPVLQLEVNGRRGWYHQQPRLAYSAGDQAVFFQPHYATGLITCDLRADLFQAGTNRFVITAVDVPGEREDVRPSGFPLPGNSGLVYDALALEQLDAVEERAVPKAESRVTPTPFFRDREGRLMNEVEVVIRSPFPMGRTEVDLSWEGAPAGTVFELSLIHI